MKILAINGTYRPEGTTFQFTEKALEGAASEGMETEHVLLVEKNIQFCTTCYTCYKDATSEIAPCPIQDDVTEILESIRDADGVILSSPIRGALETALMKSFLERALFRLARPTGTSQGVRGCPEPRLTRKTRAVATLAVAGAVTADKRQTCDMITPMLSWYGACLVNGLPIGDMYAAAWFPKEMKDEDWERAFLLREIPDEQFDEAYELGAKMGRAINSGELPAYDMKVFEPPT